jgi:Polysaccharide deacetylase
MNRSILLSFDVEEFDIPMEFGQSIEMVQQMEIGKRGLDAISPILNEVATTLFTTANFADHFPSEIKKLSEQHEIASHTYYHGSFVIKDLLNSRLRLENITGKAVTGLRMPRMKAIDMPSVKAAGYAYDSSINPTWIPGKYNNLHLSRTVYTEEGMKRLPASVSPHFRIPLFWLSFKNMPYAVFKQLCIQTIRKDGYICLYFHPWEFTPINEFGLPGYTRRWCGPQLVSRLLQLIKDLRKEGDFIPINQLPNLKN